MQASLEQSGICGSSCGVLAPVGPQDVLAGLGEIGRAASSDDSFTQKYLSGSGGRWGNASTRALNFQIGQTLAGDGYQIVAGGGVGSEEYIKGPGPGTTGGTFVDITAVSSDNTTIRIQTISTLSDGVTPTVSEAAAAKRIEAA